MEDKIFEVYFTGKDERGFITKGIKIVAESETDAMSKANELNSTTEIFSAIEIKPSSMDE